jgi:para-nitrobenzyl esterase
MCAADLLAAPSARGLVQRAILQSGAARNVHPPEVALRVAAVFCAEAGVARGDAAALRRLPVDALLAAQERTHARLARELTDPPFEPVVDGALLPVAPAAALAAGAAADVPLLVGTNRDEWKYYGLGDPKARLLDEAGLLRRFRRALPGVDASGRPWSERVIEVYREARAGSASVHPRELWFAIQTDRWFRHPAATLAASQARHQPRTWAYLFTWSSPALGGALGSCHALELPFVFGCVDSARLRGVLGEGPERRALSQRIQDAWLAFARGDVPGAPGLPAWPAYEGERRSTMRLDVECGCVEAPGERELAFWDEVC